MLAISLVSMAQESVVLRLNYNAGDKYLVSMNVNQGEMMSVALEMDMDVKEVQDTIYKMEMGIKSMKMDMNQGGMPISYDSTLSEDELDEMGKVMHSQMSPMFSAIISTTMTNRAETIETTIDPPIQGMGDLTSNSSAVVYPKQALKVGDSWTANKMENGMDMKMTYTINSIESDVVNVDLSGTIELMAEGTISGNIVIDKDSGNVNSSSMVMDMKVQGQEMKMDISMSSKKL